MKCFEHIKNVLLTYYLGGNVNPHFIYTHIIHILSAKTHSKFTHVNVSLKMIKRSDFAFFADGFNSSTRGLFNWKNCFAV